jgi:hypothetical protein
MITIEKNQWEFIGIEKGNYNGVPVVDIRVWRRSRKSPEGFRTRKGLTIQQTLLKPFLEACQRLEMG